MKIRLSAFVRSDLQEITAYIAQDSQRYALEMVQRLRREFIGIGANPYLFRLRPDLGLDLRQAFVGQYVILFRIQVDTVYVERVLHGMRDLPSHLQ